MAEHLAVVVVAVAEAVWVVMDLVSAVDIAARARLEVERQEMGNDGHLTVDVACIG